MRKHFKIVDRFEFREEYRVVVGNGSEFFVMTSWLDGRYTRPGYASQTVETRVDFDLAAIGAKKYPTAEAAKQAWLLIAEAE